MRTAWTTSCWLSWFSDVRCDETVGRAHGSNLLQIQLWRADSFASHLSSMMNWPVSTHYRRTAASWCTRIAAAITMQSPQLVDVFKTLTNCFQLPLILLTEIFTIINSPRFLRNSLRYIVIAKWSKSNFLGLPKRPLFLIVQPQVL